jgi:hypothetical protein
VGRQNLEFDGERTEIIIREKAMQLVRIILASAALSVTLVLAADAPEKPKVTAPDEPKDMKALLNGKDLDGWDGDPKLWSFKDGAVRGETTKENPTKGNTFLIYKQELGDFERLSGYRLFAIISDGVRSSGGMSDVCRRLR